MLTSIDKHELNELRSERDTLISYLNTALQLISCRECCAFVEKPKEMYGWMPGLCPDYQAAMTTENLHGKFEIACELAWRDVQLAERDARIEELEKIIVTAKSCLQSHDEFHNGQLNSNALVQLGHLLNRGLSDG